MKRFIHHILLFIALTLAAANAGAATLTVTAGGLRSAVEAGSHTGDIELVLTGSMNVTDFEFMALNMPALQKLDLSQVVVEAYDGEQTFTGRTHCEAGALPECALLGLPLMSLKLPKDLKAIKPGALAGLRIREIELPGTLTEIGDHAFADCAYLTSVTVPASVQFLGKGAFKGCANLGTAVIGCNPDSIGSFTFAGCRSLRSVNLPQSIKSIGESAFNGCAALTAVAFPERIEHIGADAFYGCGLQEIDFTGCTYLKSIGSWAFAGNISLADVRFPSGLKEIGTGAFFSNSSLRAGSIPTALTEVPDFAFTGATATRDLLAGSNVEHIGKYALADWTGVQVFVLPATLETLDEGAMANWSDLDTIRADKLTIVPALGDDVWGDISKNNVYLRVTPELKDAFAAAPQWQDFSITTNGPDSSTLVAEHTVTETPIVKARFEGLTLHLTASDDITGVQFHDISGRSFTLPASADGQHMSVDTSAWDAEVMIVRVRLADGNTAVLKLLR